MVKKTTVIIIPTIAPTTPPTIAPTLLSLLSPVSKANSVLHINFHDYCTCIEKTYVNDK